MDSDCTGPFIIGIIVGLCLTLIFGIIIGGCSDSNWDAECVKYGYESYTSTDGGLCLKTISEEGVTLVEGVALEDLEAGWK